MTDILNLSGRVAIVTGGNGGIGKAIADGFASKGASLVIAARNQARITQTVRQIRQQYGTKVLGVQVDVLDEPSIRSAVQKTLDRFERIDILVNNAGVVIRKHPQDFAEEEWNLILNTNLRGAFQFCQAVYPAMKKVNGGKIINIGSIASLVASGHATPYAASKAGLLQMTYSLALAWSENNIRVNAILPGWIKTPLNENAVENLPNVDEHVATRVPLARWGKPADIVGAALLLASDASSFITGEYIRVDGGYIQGVQIM